MDWFLGQFVLVTVCLVGATLTGRGLIGLIGSRRYFNASPEAFALAAIVGVAVWELCYAWMSYFGLGAQVIRVPLMVLAVVLVAVAALRRGRVLFRINRSFLAMTLGTIVTVAAVASLLPLAIGNAYDALNDTYSYVSIAEYLQNHGFGTPVVLDPYQLVPGQTWQLQMIGAARGAAFLLAFMQSVMPLARAIELFPALMALGVILNVLAVFLCARWVAGLSRRISLLAAFAMAVAPVPMQSSAANGFLAQTFGTAALLATLALLSRVFRSSRLDIRSSLLLASAGGFLMSVYPDVSPVLLGCGALALPGAVVSASRREKLGAVLLNIAAAVAAMALVANIELFRAVKGLQVLSSVVAGWNVSWGLTEFWSFAVGVRPGGAETGIILPALGGLTGALAGGATFFFAIGLVSLFRRRRSDLIPAALGIYGALLLYFAFLVKNPWDGGIGQPWDIYKLEGWFFPFVIVVEAAGIQQLARVWRFPWLIRLTVAGLVCVSVPSQFKLASERAAYMQQAAHSSRPFEAYRQLVEAVDRYRPDTIDLVSLPGAVWPKVLYTYLFYPRPIAGDWTDTSYIAGTYPAGDARVSPSPVGKTLYLAPVVFEDGASLPGGLQVMQDVSVVNVENPNGIEQENGHTIMWLGGGETKLSVVATRDGAGTLSLSAVAGPGAPNPSDIGLQVTEDGNVVAQFRLQNLPLANISVPLKVGMHTISLLVTDRPKQVSLRNRDPRDLMLKVGDLQVAFQGAGPLTAQASSLAAVAQRPLQCQATLSDGWFGLEQSSFDWWHWTQQQGQVTVAGASAGGVLVQGQFLSQRVPNRIQLSVNGEVQAAVDVDRSPKPFDLRLDLTKGTNVITFLSDARGTVEGSDPRPLGIAVQDLAIGGPSGTCDVTR